MNQTICVFTVKLYNYNYVYIGRMLNFYIISLFTSVLINSNYTDERDCLD